MTVICNANELENNNAKGFVINNQHLVAVKKDEQVHVYVNSCPHIGITLEFQPDQFLDLENRFIQCANHGALFEIETGDCIAGPCIGQALKRVPVELRDQQVVLIGDIPAPY